MKKLAASLLNACLLAVAPSSAGAVTLLVNGDTPAIRWQQIADRAPLPQPPGEITLRFGDEAAAAAACRRDGALGCYGNRAITIGANGRHAVAIFRHELGHAYRDLVLSDAEAADLLAAAGGAAGDDPDEVIADAYMACSVTTDVRAAARYAATWGTTTRTLTAGQVRTACLWIRERGGRPAPRPASPEATVIGVEQPYGALTDALA